LFATYLRDQRSLEELDVNFLNKNIQLHDISSYNLTKLPSRLTLRANFKKAKLPGGVRKLLFKGNKRLKILKLYNYLLSKNLLKILVSPKEGP
jgi:hypothetical protein